MARELTAAQQLERSIIKKFRKSIWNKMVMCLKEYKMIVDGDRIAVGISGGKSSVVMAIALSHLKLYSPESFELKLFFVDTGFKADEIADCLRLFEMAQLPVEIIKADVSQRLQHSDKPHDDYESFVCSTLSKAAENAGCNKLALASHFDDAIEFIFAGMVFGARVECIMPRIRTENAVEIIRPMLMVREEYLDSWARYNKICLPKSPFELMQFSSSRMEEENCRICEIKQLMSRFRSTNEFIETNIFKSVYNVNLRTIVSYTKDSRKTEFLDRYASLADNVSGGLSDEDF